MKLSKNTARAYFANCFLTTRCQKVLPSAPSTQRLAVDSKLSRAKLRLCILLIARKTARLSTQVILFFQLSEFLSELILNCATKPSCPNTPRLWRMNSARSNCAAPLRRNAAPLMRRCLSLEHVCKHTAVNKCANRGRGSAESRVALCFFGHEAAAVVCCFSSLCVRSPEPRHQIVAAGKKNPTRSYLR